MFNTKGKFKSKFGGTVFVQDPQGLVIYWAPRDSTCPALTWYNMTKRRYYTEYKSKFLYFPTL